jgi:hypothetical protein
MAPLALMRMRSRGRLTPYMLHAVSLSKALRTMCSAASFRDEDGGAQPTRFVFYIAVDIPAAGCIDGQGERMSQQHVREFVRNVVPLTAAVMSVVVNDNPLGIADGKRRGRESAGVDVRELPESLGKFGVEGTERYEIDLKPGGHNGEVDRRVRR